MLTAPNDVHARKMLYGRWNSLREFSWLCPFLLGTGLDFLRTHRVETTTKQITTIKMYGNDGRIDL
uniref:Uncharacterized protein n=1 Tax=Octopus bimaculoides TaxID=37653 RepID=A0A0L8HXH6_OCTBM